MGLNEGLIYTNENCIGCNRCISGCPVLGANVSIQKDGRNYIYVDNDKCLHCGRCLMTCQHNAREYRDDTKQFFEDLAAGESISLLVAPSFFILYEKKAFQILGYLKECGVKFIYDVSYGADIAAWAYLSYIEEYQMAGAIAPPCSAVVNYIQKYSKLLTDQLIPIHSPLMCLAVYIRRYLERGEKLAFLSPCIAKKDEIDDCSTDGLVQYNVTFAHLMQELKGQDVSNYHVEVDTSDVGLGRLFPVPGGLSDNIRHFVSSEYMIRELHGEQRVYEYFSELEQRIMANRKLPYLIDCLNCNQGCLSGTATNWQNSLDDDIFFCIQNGRRPNSKMDEAQNPYIDKIPLEERRKRLAKRFENLQLKHFMRDYHADRFIGEEQIIESKAEYEAHMEEIYHAMHKDTAESRCIDCHSCGYSSCKEMVTAIYYGYNHIENCVHYVKDENHRVSMIDSRSGIPNYNAFLEFTDRLIQKKRLNEFTAIYFNIINFKYINQKYGFRRGDQALLNYSHIVTTLVDESEILALAGGNNFIAMIRKEHLDFVMEQLKDIPLPELIDTLTGEPERIAARVAVYEPEDDVDMMPQVIMEKLSSTFHLIDRTQNQQILYYDEELRQQIIHEDFIMHAVEPGLRAEEFVVYYQPKVDMNTRKVIGAEALIRWMQDGKLIPPMEFIPVCEKVGMVQKLDFFVLETVCKDIKNWIEKGIPTVKISINFSRNHFVENQVADHINEVIEKYSIPKELIEIEFTETAHVGDGTNLTSNIDKLHEYGISASMDDFGTGYSSLSMLQNMSFDTLKLDKSFLEHIAVGNHRSRTVIEHIVHMAKELDMDIVSEGIETEQELEYMKNINCDIAQGYLFDKPLTREEFEKRLVQVFYPKE